MKASSESSSELALSAFFGLCVPAVSDGFFEQTFDAIRALTEEEVRLYGPGGQERFMIDLAEPILFEVDPPYCRIITADGDPQEGHQRFVEYAQDWGARPFDRTEHAGAVTDAYAIPLRDGWRIIVQITIGLAEADEGFSASAARFGPRQ
jgi:hypothetical protein